MHGDARNGYGAVSPWPQDRYPCMRCKTALIGYREILNQRSLCAACWDAEKPKDDRNGAPQVCLRLQVYENGRGFDQKIQFVGTDDRWLHDILLGAETLHEALLEWRAKVPS